MKEFCHFNDGFRIEDSEINCWLHQIRERLLEGRTHSAISSGDTVVIGMAWPSEYQLMVCNSSGRSTLRFSTYDEVELMRKYDFQYVRPVSVLTNS